MYTPLVAVCSSDDRKERTKEKPRNNYKIFNLQIIEKL